VGAVRSDQDAAFLEQLLDGTAVIPGLAIDTDLRWGIITVLAMLGRAGARIEAELQRDPTDQGQRHAATARTAQPSADAKGDAWRAIVEDAALPLATMRAMIGGFWMVDQAELLAPYRDRFFEALEPMWDQRDPEVALTFAMAMYPITQMDEQLLAVTDAHLERGDVPPALRRPLIEGRDEAARALRARAKDAEA